MAKLAIVVRFQFIGIHSWPAAPAGPEDYLRYPHRHVFHVEATKLVDHEERDIEFIGFKLAMQEYVSDIGLEGPHTMSCETMARGLLAHFNLSKCRVFEDDENGAEVTQ